MRIHPIRTQNEFEKALGLIDQLWLSPQGSEEYDQFEVLATLIEEFEKKKYPVTFPDPIEAIHFYMDQQGLVFRNLAELIGYDNSVAILKKKKRLTLTMIRKLCMEWQIPADVLVKPYKLEWDQK